MFLLAMVRIRRFLMPQAGGISNGTRPFEFKSNGKFPEHFLNENRVIDLPKFDHFRAGQGESPLNPLLCAVEWGAVKGFARPTGAEG